MHLMLQTVRNESSKKLSCRFTQIGLSELNTVYTETQGRSYNVNSIECECIFYTLYT